MSGTLLERFENKNKNKRGKITSPLFPKINSPIEQWVNLYVRGLKMFKLTHLVEYAINP